MHELPLLIFTLFLQGSVGVTLWLAFGSTQRSVLLPAAGCRSVCVGQPRSARLRVAHGLST